MAVETAVTINGVGVLLLLFLVLAAVLVHAVLDDVELGLGVGAGAEVGVLGAVAEGGVLQVDLFLDLEDLEELAGLVLGAAEARVEVPQVPRSARPTPRWC